LSASEAERSAWTIEPDGRRQEGAAALNRVLFELGGGWRALAAAYRMPAIAALEEAGYRWFAANRGRFSRFGVTPECEDPAADCTY
jgi:predicted DCC family thiol-disulfide oxidoreductase YuxK